jgi:caa(3)-type oxidase subunit IV
MAQVDEKHDIVDGHPGPTFQAYILVFLFLCIFTAISFVVNWILGIGSHTGMAIILAVAVCKATLVIMFFMHLKYEWLKLYFLIIPVGILGVMMMIVLLPDIVLGWKEPAPGPAAHAEK